MARPRKWENDVQRRQAQNDRRKRERQGPSTFIGIDGEGTGRGSEHKYVLLGAGDKQIENENGLSFGECLHHIWSQFLIYPSVTFCGFFLGYDFCQWFKGLPEDRAYYLFHPEKRSRREHSELGPFPVGYQEWEFDILGMKRFKFRVKGWPHWCYVNDSGPFFQASLMSVIDPKKWNESVVTEEEYAVLEAGKSKRDSAVLDDDMRRYNRLENAILARLLQRTDAGLRQAGIRLHRNEWFGPGQAAQKWLATTAAPDRKVFHRTIADHGTIGDNVQSFAELAKRTYYGGWFEIFAHGIIPGTSWEYDINSAYPAVASKLSCLLHGRWSHGYGVPGGLAEDSLCIVHCTVRGSDKRCGAMLHRRPDHSILRPHRTGGWYWEHELRAAIGAGVIDDVEFMEWAAYDPCDCPSPLGGLRDLYSHRLQVGKNTSAGKGAKTIYNSVYGKLAQSIGEPKFANAIYASLITAGCRTMDLNAIATHPEGTSGLLMVATDGVYFRSPHPGLDISAALGDWEETTHENLTLFKPGVYWDDNTRIRLDRNESPAFKARGISAKAFASELASIDNTFRGWTRGSDSVVYPSVTFSSSFGMITCKQALDRGKWDTAGLVFEPESVQDSDPYEKRQGGWWDSDIWRSYPHETGGPVVEATVYDKNFGQPDPEEFGITDDGTVQQSWRDILLAQ